MVLLARRELPEDYQIIKNPIDLKNIKVRSAVCVCVCVCVCVWRCIHKCVCV